MGPEEEELVERAQSDTAEAPDLRDREAHMRQRALAVLDMADSDLFETETLADFTIPDRASLYRSVTCDACGVPTMSIRTRQLHDLTLCASCYEEEIRSCVVLRPLGLVTHATEGDTGPRGHASVEATIALADESIAASLGVEPGGQLQVVYQRETREQSGHVQQRARGRLGPSQAIGFCTTTLVRLDGNVVVVSGLDAAEGSLVLALQPGLTGCL